MSLQTDAENIAPQHVPPPATEADHTLPVAPTPPEPTPPPDGKRLIPQLYIGIGVIIILLLAALTIWGMVFLASNYAIEVSVIRDLFIIALALESCIFGVVLLIMLLMMIRLVNTVEFEIKPLLRRTNDTVGLIRGTTQFLADNVVQPTIKARSYVAGVRQGVRSLFGNPKDPNIPDL